MRIEKAYITGADLNGQTTAAELGAGRMMKKARRFHQSCAEYPPGARRSWQVADGRTPFRNRQAPAQGSSSRAKAGLDRSLGCFRASRRR